MTDAVDDPEAIDFVELGRLEFDLMRRFCPPLSCATVRRCVTEAVSTFEQARVRAFLPILIERRATEQLHALVEMGGTDVGDHLSAPASEVELVPLALVQAGRTDGE